MTDEHPDQTRPLPLSAAWSLTRGAVEDTVRADVPGTRRGLALLMVMIIIAIIGALSIQFTYQTRANIWMSGNLYASTQAYFNARSAKEIAMLVVNAKKNFPQFMGMLNMGGSRTAAARMQLWQRACELVNIYATGKAEFLGMAVLDFSDEEAVGGRNTRQDEPAFTCHVEAEDARVNINRAATEIPIDPMGGAGAGSGARLAGATTATLAQQQRAAAQLYVQLGGLLQPMVEQGLFASEDEAIDVILNIIDWTDADDSRSEIDPQGNFAQGTGAEGGDYGQYGYQAKNAKMDTIGEVQLVEGMSSDVYCRIRDKLTVFATDKINVNDADLGVLKGVLCQAIQDEIVRAQLCLAPGPSGLPPIDDALIAMESCRRIKKQIYSTPFTSMSRFNQFFQRYPAAMGTGVAFPINTSIVSQQLGVQTRMVRIESEGFYGDTKRKMVSIVDTANGALVHYHYE